MDGGHTELDDSVEVVIREIGRDEAVPVKLLLLADPSEDLIAGYVRRGRCFVAEADRQVVGVYVLMETRPLTVEVVNVAVDERCQGRGIGRRLVMHAVGVARREGYGTVEIGTGNSSVGQMALYQKCGFRIVGVEFDYFTRHYVEPIYENGIQCRDMVRLSLQLSL